MTNTLRLNSRILLAAAVANAAFMSAGIAMAGNDSRGGIITVSSPKYCGDISGSTTVVFKAPGFKTVDASAFNGKEVEVFARNVRVAEDGSGSFNLPAGRFPRGPLTVTIAGKSAAGDKEYKDNCYLQLYNTSGRMIAGMPKTPPPAAKGMKLVFADDFTDPKLSIGKGPNFKYYDHKPPDGSQDFSEWSDAMKGKPGGKLGFPFTSFDKPNNPFKQRDTFLRIRAEESKGSTGIIASMQGDGSGFKASVPCYFECRFIAPNAPGSWPAFWLLTDNLQTGGPCDELDIIEAYGGEGPGNPNSFDKYEICPHAWGQGEEGKRVQRAASKSVGNPQKMRAAGVSSAWYESFHTYGCLITEEDTIYYCDDIEMARHKTMPVSKAQPHYFLVNLAVGGISGWKIDLDRYDGVIDMYIDYIRVYEGL
jgi:beta-glucanase (GH16 family)